MVRHAVLVLALFAVMACGRADPGPCPDSLGCVDVGPDGPLRIAAIQVLSGGIQQGGLNQVRAIEMALAARGGGLLGHPLALQVEDGRCSKEGGRVAAQKIAADSSVIAVLGATCSSSSAAAAKILSDAGLTLISASSTAPSLTAVGGAAGADWRPGFFRTIHNDAAAGAAAAAFARRSLGLGRAAVVHDGGPYGLGLAGAFRDAFARLGGETVLVAEVGADDEDMGPVLAAVAEARAGVLFFPLFRPASVRLLFQARQMPGLDRTILLGSDASFAEAFFDEAGAAAKGVHFVLPSTPEGGGKAAFEEGYARRYGERPVGIFHAHAYDAANLLLDAIQATATRTPGGGLRIGRQALRDALLRTSGHRGLTGILACDRFGDCGVSNFKVVRVDNPAAGLPGAAGNVFFLYDQAPAGQAGGG
ncbi:MAG: branched-chain amino acid ABC transporter substrate-binding protein [Thermodesulfobacteriota bacterium]